MAESHVADVDGISEDEQEVLNDEESTPTNEYPDPDYVHNYPWLGERNPLHENGPMFCEQPTIHEDIDQGYPDNGSQQRISFEGLDPSGRDSPNPYPLPRAGRDPNDPSLDPDFQLSNDGAAYVPGNSSF